MLILAGPSDRVQVVAAQAVNALHVHASYVDSASGVITPGRRNTVITAAGATDVVPAPASGAYRNVRLLRIENADGALGTQVTARHTDGTTAVDLASVVLLPGESLTLDDTGMWAHCDANGAPYAPNTPFEYAYALGVAGTIAETIPRILCPEANLAALTSGTLSLHAIYLRAGQRISSISFMSATTAAATPTNQWFALYDQNRALLRQTVNDGAAAWAANSIKTLPLTSPYTVTYTGLHYVGIMVTATTVPTLKGLAAKTASQLAGLAPILHGNSSTGLTTAAPDPAAAITVGVNAVWARVA